MPAHGRRHRCFKCNRVGYRSSPRERSAYQSRQQRGVPAKDRLPTGLPATATRRGVAPRARRWRESREARLPSPCVFLSRCARMARRAVTVPCGIVRREASVQAALRQPRRRRRGAMLPARAAAAHLAKKSPPCHGARRPTACWRRLGENRRPTRVITTSGGDTGADHH